MIMDPYFTRPLNRNAELRLSGYIPFRDECYINEIKSWKSLEIFIEAL